MTKVAFLAVYEQQLKRKYVWADNPARLARFMGSVRDTLAGATTWNHEGEAVTAAWRLIGGKGSPTLKALRGLP